MNIAFHPNLAAGGWKKLSLAEQLGNIGSEVHRALRWHGQDQSAFQRAFERTLELTDLTIADPRWRTGRRELTRLREVLCDFFFGGNVYRTDARSLQAYFDSFVATVRQ